MNYYRRYSGDYLRDTARLNLTEHGAYTLLLDYYYSDERALPADHDELYLMVRAMRTEDRKAVEKVLAMFFRLEPDGYHQKRVDHEIAVSKQARFNGKGGGRPPTGSLTGLVTGSQTEPDTGYETEDITGCDTGNGTDEGGGSGHPPSTNHQPLTTNNQPPKKPSAASDRISLSAAFEWEGVSAEKRSLWAKAYPAVNLDAELAAAAAWVMENPSNRKSNWGRFITGWLKKAQDKAPRFNGSVVRRAVV